MQDFAYVEIKGIRILVLRRAIKNGVALKIRGRKDSDIQGTFLQAESEYLSTNPRALFALKSGKVVKL